MNIHESKENYLKTVLVLQRKTGGVRSIDIANELGLTRASVCNAIKKLQNEDLVNMDEHHFLSLTPEGEEYAKNIIESHRIIKDFLTNILQVNEETAQEESCKLEHVVSSETISKIKQLCEEYWFFRFAL